MRSLNETNGPSGPFEKALRTFATGGPIPLVVGCMCPQLVAARTPFGQQLSPDLLES